MRANEIVQMYDSTSQKEAIKTGVELAENVFEW
jgi:hypothetical protein